MLVFDRMARGLRLSIALEARLARERRCDAREIEHGLERGIARDARPARAEPGDREERDREREDDGLPEATPLADQIGRLKQIVEGAGGPEPAPPLARAERRALALQRTERARLAARDLPPDEPWDVLTPFDRTDHDLAADPSWPGAG